MLIARGAGARAGGGQAHAPQTSPLKEQNRVVMLREGTARAGPRSEESRLILLRGEIPQVDGPIIQDRDERAAIRRKKQSDGRRGQI